MAEKGRIDLVISQDDGKTWTAPRPVAQGRDDHRNPAFGQLADGTLVLAYVVLHGYDQSGLLLLKDSHAWYFSGPYVIRSSDSGKTWTKPEQMPGVYPVGVENASPYGKISQLPDGTALMVVYYSKAPGTDWESYVFRSKDGGKTWGNPSLIAKGYNETTLAVLPDGKLVAAMRSGDNAPHLGSTYSTDKGYTWSTPVAITDQREAPGDLIVLRGGKLLLTFGASHVPRGVRAYLSRDEGRTWSPRLILADDIPCGAEGGYPSSVQLPDGNVLTVYYQVDVRFQAELSPGVLWKSLEGAKALGVIWKPPAE